MEEQNAFFFILQVRENHGRYAGRHHCPRATTRQTGWVYSPGQLPPFTMDAEFVYPVDATDASTETRHTTFQPPGTITKLGGRDAYFREANRKLLLGSARNPTSGAVVKVSSLIC
jgi:hypothetical protein